MSLSIAPSQQRLANTARASFTLRATHRRRHSGCAAYPERPSSKTFVHKNIHHDHLCVRDASRMRGLLTHVQGSKTSSAKLYSASYGETPHPPPASPKKPEHLRLIEEENHPSFALYPVCPFPGQGTCTMAASPQIHSACPLPGPSADVEIANQNSQLREYDATKTKKRGPEAYMTVNLTMLS